MHPNARAGIFLFNLLQILGHDICVNNSIVKEFYFFNTKYNKQIPSNKEMFHQRLQIFAENLKEAAYLDKGEEERYGVTQFSDLTKEEYSDMFLNDLKMQHTFNWEKPANLTALTNLSYPPKHDWRNFKGKNFVSPIKNQKACGGCWAFSTVEVIESMYAIQKGNVSVPDLSVQEVIDCSYNNAGCSGGDPIAALEWMVQSKVPLVSGQKYPLTDISNYCNVLPAKVSGVTVKNFKGYSLIGNEEMMISLLYNHGPLVVSVDATTWAHYQMGIIQHHCDNKINHAVSIVGYDLTGDVPYFIIRNSWGTGFGDYGYLYIKIGENLCGIASRVAVASVDTS